MCDPDFWKMLEAVLLQSTTCVDHVLSTCLDMFQKKGVSVSKCWPRSKRTLRDLISRKLGNFWSAVTVTKSIDVRGFNIPGVHSTPARTMNMQCRCNSNAPHMCSTCNLHLTCNTHLIGITRIPFSFLDPVYVWIRQAQSLVERGIDLVWKPKIVRQQPSNEPMYGSGIEYGLLLRHEVESVPEGGFPALMNISWDSGGTNMKSRSAIPICLQVIHTIHTYFTCDIHVIHIFIHVKHIQYTCILHATHRL